MRLPSAELCELGVCVGRSLAHRAGVLAALRTPRRRSRRRSTSAGSTRLLGAARRRSARNCGARPPRAALRVHVADRRHADGGAACSRIARPGAHGRRAGRRSRGARADPDRHAVEDRRTQRRRSTQRSRAEPASPRAREPRAISAFKRWGLKTLGELAALPPADLVGAARAAGPASGRRSRAARTSGRSCPMLAEERFESSLDLEWPIEGLEPLSFVLTRLLEPLSTRLERRDRGAAVLHVAARARSTQRRPRAPAGAAVADARRADAAHARAARSRIASAAAPRSIASRSSSIRRRAASLQHTLFTRAHPTPEQLSTLLARLGALMGQDRIGAPATGRFVSSRVRSR